MQIVPSGRPIATAAFDARTARGGRGRGGRGGLLAVQHPVDPGGLPVRLPHPLHHQDGEQGHADDLPAGPQDAPGDLLVGWGSEPYFTEFAPDGSIRFDARLPHGGQNYRVLRFSWSGRPTSPPHLVAKERVVYASWNGATELASWRLRTGTSAATLEDAGETVVRAFETAFTVPAGTTHAAVVALDERGDALATSATIRV